jgi:hypothetical protein
VLKLLVVSLAIFVRWQSASGGIKAGFRVLLCGISLESLADGVTRFLFFCYGVLLVVELDHTCGRRLGKRVIRNRCVTQPSLLQIVS